MKLTRIMYLHKILHLAKNWGVTRKVKESVVEKLLETKHNELFWLISWNFRTISKAVMYVIRKIVLHFCSKF